MLTHSSALVSILIPAYNAERWIAETIRSALDQTWSPKEIVVVDDGSTDETAAIARTYASASVKVIEKRNEGAAATRNAAMTFAQGDYIQWLDADDLLAPDKISLQMARRNDGDPRVLLSSAWAYFAYRPHRAKFTPTALWADQSPVDWLVHKLGENLQMQTATWLTNRALTSAAGPWDTRLQSDDDGEYFARVLLASSGVRFVPEAKVYYRSVPGQRVGYIGASQKKMDAMLLSMRLHMNYLRSLEQSARVNRACVNYMQNWLNEFDPARKDIADELRSMARDLGGDLRFPIFRRKYEWIAMLVGERAAWRAQLALPRAKARALCWIDKQMSLLENR